MSAREVHVRIGRLVVDAPLRGEAMQWREAVERALQARLMSESLAVAPVPEAIAQHVERHVVATVPQKPEPARPMPPGPTP